MNSSGYIVVRFFVNLIAALYGLIGFFSIIPFLLFSFLFSTGFVDSSQDFRQLYLILILGGTSSFGISIIFLVYRFNDLGRKLMIVFSLAILSLLLSFLWQGRIVFKVLTHGNTIALSIIILILIGVISFLFHPKVKQFFRC